MSGWRASVRARLGALELDVDLEGGPGVLAIVGPNGSGKTTLLRILAGAVAAQRAELVVGERPLDVLPVEARGVGYVPQGFGLFPHLDVLGNVAFGLSTRGVPRAERRERARRLLAELGCEGLAARGVHSLSGGEQQRVALARALVIEPRLLLLDEPLAALDATTRRTVRTFLAERLRAYGRPTLLVTHDPRDIAALDATVCVLEAGRAVQRGTLEALRADPATDFVAEFAGAA